MLFYFEAAARRAEAVIVDVDVSLGIVLKVEVEAVAVQRDERVLEGLEREIVEDDGRAGAEARCA